MNQKTYLILHGNNFDSNRGCQALRISTEIIFDRYLPNQPRIHANIFKNAHPQFLKSPAGKEEQIFEIHKERNLWFYLWGINIVGCRLWHLEAPMKVTQRIKKMQKEGNSGALIALGGDNWSFDYGNMALHLFTAPFFSAVRRRFPTVIWGGSIGPFSSRPAYERKMARLLSQIDLITSREQLTTEYLYKLGCGENVREIADPAFLLPVNKPKNLPEKLERLLEEGAVGINLAPLFARYVHKTQKKWLDEVLASFVHFVEHCDYKVIMVPHVMMEPEVFPNNNDFLFMKKIFEALPAKIKERVFLYDSRNDDCTNIKWVISRTIAFAGCRTHATIAALSTGVPVFCIGYSVKSRGINLDLFGHEQWVEHFSKLGGQEFSRRFLQLIDSSSEVKAQLDLVLPAYKAKALKGGEYLLELFQKRGLK